MSLIQSLRLVLAKPHPAARPFLLASGAGLLMGRATGWRPTRALGTLSGLFFGFCLYFFRDPKRVTPAGDVVVSAADGRVVSIEKIAPPAELAMGDQPVWRVATFLSVLDVHVNRMPAAGTVTGVAYHAGQFLNASLDKASDLNERNALRLTLRDGRNIAVVQIAGLIARRILCSARDGMVFEAGERFGLIRFGSRTDVYLPPGVEPLVEVGQTMIGGETVLARL
ncbi:phosphatidylserine decarboxylase [Ameyamaea chiangmaiensis NBRC 103196]|uniref:Phosphatidylserine decarboxylase proenzyme n=1 Tax=Ameyamaea chiangmaiensis TaxID=442969 RepID=A0A850PCB5_9PROT|nr:phosphatidylserine decarboxylase [Ameyamaea chiangmaiensis]MBS4074451.1 phosphatidylserine decarboxylase [Ameyamaea chiangmaiensis]NVN41764.1 phosphatidylserine decarboxylase [Ameyamaea chiangmaiensis]GBQ72087.1 phosphatidylserine decarboxylase [Ameyamaea chiangmaiensis NBRC 103196]